jgi:hypothetical protein
MTASLAHYLNNDFSSVQGWCIPHLWQSLWPLREAMRKQGKDGPVAEIGVYHGKFFIGLVKTMEAPRHNYAIDVFDLQQFNLDGAVSAMPRNSRKTWRAARSSHRASRCSRQIRCG